MSASPVAGAEGMGLVLGASSFRFLLVPFGISWENGSDVSVTIF